MLEKQRKRKKRHRSIRKRIAGTHERPRLTVFRSLKNLYVQVIDDFKETTLLSSATSDANFARSVGKVKKQEAASQLGRFFANQMKEKGIKKIAFDRSGYQYHGRVKALAEALREGGIEF